MLFNSFSFLFVFLPIVLALTWAIRVPRWRVIFWTFASYLFYAFAGPWFVALLVGSTIVDFLIAQRIEASTREHERKILLVISIAFGLGLLGFFKYANFFAESINATTMWLHGLFRVPATALGPVLRIALPAGISFYTFMTMSYTIDVYRREIPAEKDFWYFASFVALFPHLIAGPVLRARDILPQLHALPSRHQARVQAGVFLLAAGLIKKVLIADRIGLYVDRTLGALSVASTPDVWLAMVGYALQIYFDFSAYTDMARGLGWLLGLDFVINFDSPYRALDPADFWRRWHISLSTWLRDYLYIPLGGNRRGPGRTYLNLFVTMVLGGLWHGAGWNFLLWGTLHGAALAMYRRFRRQWDALPSTLRRAAMFTFIVLSWVPFRLHGAEQILTCYRLMFSLDFTSGPTLFFAAYLAIGIVMAVLIRKNSNQIAWATVGPLGATALGLLTSYAVLHMSAAKRFLYFQF